METNFGARLKELRIARGVTQRELAIRIGVDFSCLSKIESGAVPPPNQKVISRIAAAFKTSENELITLAGENIPLEARIIAIADAYEAMTAMRPYRDKAMSTEEAIIEIGKTPAPSSTQN